MFLDRTSLVGCAGMLLPPPPPWRLDWMLRWIAALALLVSLGVGLAAVFL